MVKKFFVINLLVISVVLLQLICMTNTTEAVRMKRKRNHTEESTLSTVDVTTLKIFTLLADESKVIAPDVAPDAKVEGGAANNVTTNQTHSVLRSLDDGLGDSPMFMVKPLDANWRKKSLRRRKKNEKLNEIDSENLTINRH